MSQLLELKSGGDDMEMDVYTEAFGHEEPCPTDTPLTRYMKVLWIHDIAQFYSPLKNNVGFLIVALWNIIRALLEVTRYRTKSTYYDNGKLGENATNYYKLSDQVRLYGILGIWGIAAVTQLLATLGMAIGLNLAVWTYVVGLGGAAVAMTVGILRYLGYNAAFKNYDDATKSAAIQTASAATMKAIDEDIFSDAVHSAALSVVLLINAPGWELAQFDAMEPAEQDAMLE